MPSWMRSWAKSAGYIARYSRLSPPPFFCKGRLGGKIETVYRIDSRHCLNTFRTGDTISANLEPSGHSMGKTAAILIIGNEILSGKVRDDNGPYLSGAFRALGVDVRRIVVVPDEESAIAAEVSDCSRRFDWVVTTGGVGPTHDDVTMAGIATGFGRKVVRDGELEAYIKSRYGPDLNEASLKLAEIPEGAQLIRAEGIRFPVVAIANVFIFPGIPDVARRKFDAIKERFQDEPFHIRRIHLNVREEDIAHHLHRLLELYPGLLLGSYPATKPGETRVVLTLESKDPDSLESAFRELMRFLPEGNVLKAE